MTKAEAEAESLLNQAEEVRKRNKYKLELKEKTEEEVEEEIKQLRPKIRRAFTYKALNKLIQGSAADMTKKAMLNLYEEKIIPHIQIHDELDISIESKEHANKIIDIMQNAVKLKIPNKVDYESGENWGDIYD
jgi:DNA polymerase I-like protein with 3'-5' exonuclease and polymerase domains